MRINSRIASFVDRWRTVRRHVVATGFVWIEKEQNQVGPQPEILLDPRTSRGHSIDVAAKVAHYPFQDRSMG